MDNPIVVIGALLAAYWYYSTYISPSTPPSTTTSTTVNPLTPLPITPAPVTPVSVANAVPATAGPVLAAAQIPTWDAATGQWVNSSGVVPQSFFASGPTAGGVAAPEWVTGIAGNRSANGWLYADGSIYFESGPAVGQASGPTASAYGGNNSQAATANGVPVSPNAVMQTIAGA